MEDLCLPDPPTLGLPARRPLRGPASSGEWEAASRVVREHRAALDDCFLGKPSFPRRLLESFVRQVPPGTNNVASYDHLLDLVCGMIEERPRVAATIYTLFPAEDDSSGMQIEVSFSRPRVEPPCMSRQVLPEEQSPAAGGHDETATSREQAISGLSKTADRPPILLTPRDARNMGATYSGNVTVRAELSQWVLRRVPTDAEDIPGEEYAMIGGKNRAVKKYHKVCCAVPQVIHEAILFSLPLMTGCKACTLTVKGGRESQYEAKGMLILQGTPRVIQAQKNPQPGVGILREGHLRAGRVPMLLMEIRSPHHFRSRNTSTMTLVASTGMPLDVTANIQFVSGGTVPFAELARVLGFDTPEEVEALVWPLGPPKPGGPNYHAPTEGCEEARRRFHGMLHTTQAHCFQGSLDDLLERSAARRDTSAKVLCTQLLSECLPQMGYDRDPLTLARKGLFLGACVRRMLLSNVDPVRFPVDFRDFEANQYMQMPHELLSIMLRQLYSNSLKLLQRQLFRALRAPHAKQLTRETVAAVERFKARAGGATAVGPRMLVSPPAPPGTLPESGLRVRLVDVLQKMTLTRSIFDLMGQGEVVVTKKCATEAPIQVANATNLPVCYYGHAARASAAVSRDGRYTEKRQYHPSKAMVLDACTTPENQNVGLTESRGVGMWVTIGTTSEPIESWLFRSGLADPLRLPEAGDAPRRFALPGHLIMVNGRVVGCCPQGVPPRAVCAGAREARRDGALPRFTAVTWMHDGVHVDCANGTMVFPLLVVSRFDRLPGVVAHCHRTGAVLWDALLDQGIVEYVSTQEAYETEVAPSWHELVAALDRGERKRFTHVIPHPSMLLGVLSAMLPFLEHNQGPRTTYAAGMISQMIGTGDLGGESLVRVGYSQWYAQWPLATTTFEDSLGATPAGQVMLVAVMNHPCNVEDAIVMSGAALELGAFRTTLYKTETVMLHCRNERFCNPDVEELQTGVPVVGRSEDEDCEILDADGLPVVGAIVRAGHVLVGRVRVCESIDPQTRVKCTTLHSASKIYRSAENAVVDKVVRSGSLCKVRLRTVRSVRIGDKLTSRYGQKGTVGKVVSKENMPFVVEGPAGLMGLQPDLIMSPEAFPGRMTIGQNIEAAVSISVMETGERVEASPWSDPDRPAHVREWASQQPKVLMADGATGVPQARRVSLGFVTYARLRQMVSDKHNSRGASGPRQPLTQLPAEGRSRGGGQRIGEMEGGILVAHGGDAIRHEAQTTRSDPATMHVCRDCKRHCHAGRRTIQDTLDALEAADPTSGAAAAAGGAGGGLDAATAGLRCNWCGSFNVAAIQSSYVTGALLMRELAVCGVGLRLETSQQ